MNSTCWVTLTSFIKHLGRTGKAVVDETEKGIFFLKKEIKLPCLFIIISCQYFFT